jgi:hypothetical protein
MKTNHFAHDWLAHIDLFEHGADLSLVVFVTQKLWAYSRLCLMFYVSLLSAGTVTDDVGHPTEHLVTMTLGTSYGPYVLLYTIK